MCFNFHLEEEGKYLVTDVKFEFSNDMALFEAIKDIGDDFRPIF